MLLKETFGMKRIFNSIFMSDITPRIIVRYIIKYHKCDADQSKLINDLMYITYLQPPPNTIFFLLSVN